MKIFCDNELILELNDTQKKVIMNDVHADGFIDDMKRRLEWSLMHKWENCYKRLKDEWEPRLAARGVESIPTNPDKFAELVFSQADYKCRATRDQASLDELRPAQ